MRRRRQAKARFYVIVIALMLIFFGVSLGISQRRLVDAAQHADALELEKEKLEIEVRELNETMEYMHTDEYIERFARDVLKLIRPGEIRYVNN